MLDDIADAFRTDLPDGRLILAPHFIDVLTARVAGLRRVVASATLAGIPVPALASAVAWFDTIRKARGTTDLVQAQRDYFGAHSFKRLDIEGDHHGPWRNG